MRKLAVQLLVGSLAVGACRDRAEPQPPVDRSAFATPAPAPAAPELSKIRRIAERITQEQANQQAAAQPDRTYTLPNGHQVTVTFDAADNRIRICFPGKPDEATRATLGQNGFNWSPYNNAWQRKITANARYALRTVIAALKMQPQ